MFERIRSGIALLCWEIIKWSEGKVPFQTSSLPDLCPTPDAKNVESYIDRLNDLLTNRPHVREIAITAPYSGGKSSLLLTYKRKFPQHNYTSISLAAFKDKKASGSVKLNDIELEQTKDTEKGISSDGKGNTDGDSSTQQQENINNIEKSIVQQILYTAKSSDMPNSRFRRIVTKPPSYFQLITQSVAIIAWLLLVFFVVKGEYEFSHRFKNFVPDLFGYIELSIWSYFLTVPILLVRDFLRYMSSVNLSKINPLKGELAFEQKKNDSVFNIYLEELIYFFTVTKSDVVIFEDLDRFERPEIFVKLKELNKLINDSNDIDDKNSPVRFIYALKDDVFTSNTRTKFFDAIIPIIPITNSSNAYPILKGLLDETEFKNDFSNKFLRDVAIFIDDMRMLKNIVAEYGVYKPTLIKSLPNLNFQKLFSFIIYKNVYCDDFALLHKGKGKLASLFEGMSSLRKSLIDELKKEISDERLILTNSNDEQLQDIEELNTLYIWNVINSITSNEITHIEGIPIVDLPNKEHFSEASNIVENLKYTVSGNRVFRHSVRFNSYNGSIKPSYDVRRDKIINKYGAERSAIENKISENQSQIENLSNWSIKQLCKSQSRERVFGKLGSESFMCYLVEKGYIDERYHLYISIFYEGAVTRVEMDYVMSVKNRTVLDPQISIKNCIEVLEYFSTEEFSDRAFFNFDMINHLIKHDNFIPLINLLDHLKLSFDTSIVLVLNSLSHITDSKKWLKTVIVQWESIWSQLVATKVLVEKDKFKLLFALLEASEINESPEDADIVVAFLNTNSKFLDETVLVGKDSSEVLSKLNYMGVEFANISESETIVEIYNLLTEYDLYAINKINLQKLLSLHDNNKEIEQFSFDNIQRLENSIFLNSVLSRVDDFVNLLIDDESISIGSSTSAILLLDNKALDFDKKILLIESKAFKIEKISDVEDQDLWIDLINNSRVESSWDNYRELLLFSEGAEEGSSMNQSLLFDYINTNEICRGLEAQKYDHSVTEKFKLCEIITDNRTSFDAFQILVSTVSTQVGTIEFSKVGDEKLSYLINEGHVAFNEQNYTSLIGSHDNLIISLIENNYGEYQKWSGFSEKSFDALDVQKLLSSTKLTDVHKSNVIRKASVSIESFDNTLRDLLTKFSSYTIGDSTLYESQETLIKLPENMLKIVITKDKGSNKALLFYIGQLQFMTKEQRTENLELLSCPYSSILTSNMRYDLPYSHSDSILASALKKYKIISSFSIEEKFLTVKRLRLNLFKQR
jgi:hypothetical protein